MQDSSGQLQSKNIEDSVLQEDSVNNNNSLTSADVADVEQNTTTRKKSKSEKQKRNTMIVKQGNSLDMSETSRVDRHGNPITTQIGVFQLDNGNRSSSVKQNRKSMNDKLLESSKEEGILEDGQSPTLKS